MESLSLHQLIRSKRKTISLEINEQGQLIIRAPLRASSFLIQDFIHRKSDWIEKNQKLAKERYQTKSQKKFIAGESFLFLGTPYHLKIVPNAASPLHLNGNFQLSAKYMEKAENIFINWYKKQALEKISEIADIYAEKMQLSYKSIKISSAKKRWGSCSSAGHLNFSWRLIMTPLFAIEYVVVHELAHLKHMNHSKRFWQLVEKYFPDHKQTRKWLKKNDCYL